MGRGGGGGGTLGGGKGGSGLLLPPDWTGACLTDDEDSRGLGGNLGVPLTLGGSEGGSLVGLLGDTVFLRPTF